MAWPLKPLADVCEIKPPKAEARRRVSDSDLVSFAPMEDLYIGQKFLVPAQTRALAEVVGSYTYFAEADVILAKITPCFENGKLGIAQGLKNGIGFGSSEYMVFRPGILVGKEWLYYFLSRQSFREEGAARMTGAVGHKRVAKEFIESYPIPVPPLPEQKRVVAILDEAIEGIDTAVANAEKNLANARELFDSYRADVFENANSTWAQTSLGKVCKFQGGSQPPKSAFSEENASDKIRLIQIRDYKSDRHVVYIPRSLARRFCDETDVMIGRYGPPLFQILRGISGAYNVALIKAVPDETVLSKDYLFRFLKNRRILRYIIDASNRAAGQIGLNKETIEPYPIAVPTLDEQAAIVRKLEALEGQQMELERNYELKLASFVELKQAILEKAFAGKLPNASAGAVLEAAE